MADSQKKSLSTVNAANLDGANKFRDDAIAAIRRGEWQQALEGLLEAHRRRPNGPFIRLRLAQVCLELGRITEAISHLQALAVNPVPGLEPMLSELRARAKEALSETPAVPKEGKEGLISGLKKRFANCLGSRKKR